MPTALSAVLRSVCDKERHSALTALTCLQSLMSYTAYDKPLEPFFSCRAVEFKEDLTAQKAQLIVARIGEWIGNGTPLQLELAYFAYVTDVVGEILFGGENLSLLAHSEFAPDW